MTTAGTDNPCTEVTVDPYEELGFTISPEHEGDPENTWVIRCFRNFVSAHPNSLAAEIAMKAVADKTPRGFTKKAIAEYERDEAIWYLKGILKPGDKVYTVLRHVSDSGMMRYIDVIVIKDNHPRDITNYVAKAVGYNRVSFDKRYCGSLKVGGCGMDMGFWVVYNLSSVLFRGGFKCLGRSDGFGDRRCPANDHSNDYGDLSRQYDDTHDPEGVERYALDRSVVTNYVSARQDWIKEQESKLWSPNRVHQSGGYALRQAWL